MTSHNAVTLPQLLKLKKQLSRSKSTPAIANRITAKMLNLYEVRLCKSFPEWKPSLFKTGDKYFLTSVQDGRYRKYLAVRA